MEKQSSLDSCSGRRLMTTSADSWSDRTMASSDLGTATAGAGATSPSRLCFDDAFIVENSDLFFFPEKQSSHGMCTPRGLGSSRPPNRMTQISRRSTWKSASQVR
ncbi:hypothetical protein TNCV_1454881 [Trichonephila clavipes]|nr:hypothetical protein TNCV_1454881 [Trichonephila clavipes]